MYWLNNEKGVKDIKDLTEQELESAITIATDRATNLMILINRYQTLRDKVSFFWYCMSSHKDIKAYIQELQAMMLQIMSSSNGKLSSIGISSFGELTINQALKVLNNPIDSKLFTSDAAWKNGFTDPENARNYVKNPTLNMNGMSSSEYLDIHMIQGYNMTRSQYEALMKLCDLNLETLKVNYSEWQVRTSRLVEEAKSRDITPKLSEDYVKRCNLVFI